MFFRPTMLALVLVVGTAAAASAQSGEFPFRRFRLRAAPQLRFAPDHSFRMRVERAPQDAFWRSLAAAERARERQFANLDRQLTLRNRAFDRIDRANIRKLELRFRGMDRVQERLDRIRLDRPMRLKRHSRII